MNFKRHMHVKSHADHALLSNSVTLSHDYIKGLLLNKSYNCWWLLLYEYNFIYFSNEVLHPEPKKELACALSKNDQHLF